MKQYIAKTFLESDKNYVLFGLLVIIILFKTIYWEKNRDVLVVEVIDGDTLIVELDGRRERIRLKGIDAPELGQMAKGDSECIDIGEYSKKYLKQRLHNQLINLRWKKRDRYQRILGQIYLDEVDINLELVHAGQALIYWFNIFDSKEKAVTYTKAMKFAKENLVGIWGLGDFYDPYKHRSRKTKKQVLQRHLCYERLYR